MVCSPGHAKKVRLDAGDGAASSHAEGRRGARSSARGQAELGGDVGQPVLAAVSTKVQFVHELRVSGVCTEGRQRQADLFFALLPVVVSRCETCRVELDQTQVKSARHFLKASLLQPAQRPTPKETMSWLWTTLINLQRSSFGRPAWLLDRRHQQLVALFRFTFAFFLLPGGASHARPRLDFLDEQCTYVMP